MNLITKIQFTIGALVCVLFLLAGVAYATAPHPYGENFHAKVARVLLTATIVLGAAFLCFLLGEAVYNLWRTE